MLWFDPHYLLFVALPLLVLSVIAQLWVRSAYAAASQILSRRGFTGAQAARYILDSAGLHHVPVEEHPGFLSDHYDPRTKVVRLSPDVFRSPSLAAIGVAAHEVGHAIQDATGYAPLVIRNFAVPLAAIGSNFGYIAILIGLFMAYAGAGVLNPFTVIGLLLIAAIAVFQLVNLPVEINASTRAIRLLPQLGIVDYDELPAVRRVLTAAAFTYVAATAAALLELLYWLWRLGLLGGRDR